MPELQPHALAVMLLTAGALILFSREAIAVETSSLAVLAVLALAFTLFPFEAAKGPLDPLDFFAGFGNEALVAICALMVASQGLTRTGALAPLGRVVARIWRLDQRLAFGAVLAMTMVVSAFTNNTPQVVAMIPILTSLAIKSGTPASRLLMPMTFAAQIGGMATPIGTSINLLVIGVAASQGVPRFGMFDFVWPAAAGALAGFVFLWLVAPRILPAREAELGDTSPRLFTAHVTLSDEAEETKVSELIKRAGGDLAVRGIVRAPGLAIAPLPDVIVRPGDQLVLRDTPHRLQEFALALGGKLYSGGTPVDDEHPLKAPEQQSAELVVTQGSPLWGRTLDQVSFDERYQLIPLAIHRPGQPPDIRRPAQLREVRMRLGDVLLVQGPAEQIAALKKSGELLVLDATTDVPHTSKAPVALAIMALIVLAASLRVVPVAVAALCGVLAMILTRCLKWRDATRVLDSSMILLTVAAIALSYALVQTGAAAWLAGWLHLWAGSAPPHLVLSALMLLMAILANVVSNSAAAVIGTPIAIELARALALPPEPFVLAVLFGVNMGFATPLADNCNLLVYSAGGYRFQDFVRVGVPLTAVMWLVLSWTLPIAFPLH